MRYALFALAAVSTLAFAGCGDNSTPAPTTEAAPTATVKPAMPGVPTTIPALPTTPPSMAPATAAAGSAAAASTTTADTLMKQASDYISQNKMDLADKTVSELETMKPNLPAQYGPQIDQLKDLLDKAKAAGGKLPAGMKLPGQ